MRFRIEQEQLNGALSKLAFALENKDDLEAYTHVAIRGSGADVRLTASNRNMDTEAKLPIIWDSPQDNLYIGVSGELIKKIVKSLPKEQISLSLEIPNIVIRSSTSTFTLPILSPETFAETFPSHTDYNANNFNHKKIDMQQFLYAIKKVWHCMNETHHKSELASIYIDNEYFVATDGYRMALYPNKIIPVETSVLLHANQIPRLLKVYNGLGNEGGIFLAGSSKIHFVCGGIACGTNLKVGTFPNYKSVVPEQGGSTISIPKTKTLDALRRVILICKRGGQSPVDLDIKDGVMSIKADSMIGKAEESVPCDHFKRHYLRINGKYLADALFQLDSEEAELELHYNSKSELKRLVIKEGEYKNVILPIRY